MASGFINFVKRATAWVLNDTVMPADMNRYENGIEDTATAIDGMLKQSVISAPGGGAVYFSSTNKVVTLRANSVFSSADGFDTNGKIKTQVITNTTEKTVTISDTIINDTLVFIFNPVEGFSYVSQDSIIYKDGVPDLSHEYMFSISQQTWFKYNTSLQKVNIAIVAIARIVNGQIVDYEVPTISSLEDKLDKSLVNISEMGKARLANLVPVPDVVNAIATYVVDSNQKLADWLNNVTGNDYTHVLIKKGTWTYNTTNIAKVYLLTLDTKVVVGEGGSKLVLSKTVSISERQYLHFGYDSKVSTKEYYMSGVNVEISCTSTGYSSCTAFLNCANLINCTGVGYSYGVSDGAAFLNCTNLINCNGNCISDGGGFRGCTNLNNCRCIGGENRYGFVNCELLVNCTANYSFNTPRGFSFCDRLSSCSAIVTAEQNAAIAFDQCTFISDCKGIGISQSNINGIGFYRCRHVLNCVGEGRATVGNGYGFDDCHIMLLNNGMLSSTTAAFNSCTMHPTGTADPVADTAAGGYNSATN